MCHRTLRNLYNEVNLSKKRELVVRERGKGEDGGMRGFGVGTTRVLAATRERESFPTVCDLLNNLRGNTRRKMSSMKIKELAIYEIEIFKL
ncbi:hypothetical protein Syun_023185 [Stephania yunnanensis]|uniref:Uncharacterized protein n=1 Tax=Stephania yunnanensis TaxID=152371 RepID=A0AAP0I3M9_9MAGN